MDETTIGERLTLYRRRQKLTQKELAKLAGISVSTMSRYERDEIKPPVYICKCLADILNVSLDRILGLEDPEGGIERQIDMWGEKQ